MSADADLDPAALAMLRRVGGQDLVSKMVAIFLERAPGQLKTVREAAASGDRQALEQAAHSLKSSSGQLGAKRLFELSAEIETSARDPGGAPADAPVDRLDAAFEAVRPRLEKELAP